MWNRMVVVEKTKRGEDSLTSTRHINGLWRCQHQKPAALLQPLSIPDWKWDKLGMVFITGLPRTRSGYDSIWVVVDRLTKVAHFIPVKTTYTSDKLAKIYMTRIVCLHGVPRTI